MRLASTATIDCATNAEADERDRCRASGSVCAPGGPSQRDRDRQRPAPGPSGVDCVAGRNSPDNLNIRYFRDDKKEIVAIAPPRVEVTEEKSKKDTKRLSYKEQRELESLPGKIEQLENRQLLLQTQMSHADFYKQSQENINSVMAELATIDAELAAAYKRWDELE